MEKKTTRRIIGVLVVIALVIILLPLMFNGPEDQSPIQTSEAKAPAFPGTEVEANAASTENTNMIPPSQSGALINRIVAPSAQQKVPSPASAETVASTTSQNLSQPGVDNGNPIPENMNMLSADLTAPMSSAGEAPMIKPINELTATNTAAENVIVIDSDGDGSTTTLTKALAQADLGKSEMQVAPIQTEVSPVQARTTVVQAQPAPARVQPTPVVTAQAAPAPTISPTPVITKSIVAAISKTPTIVATAKKPAHAAKKTVASAATTAPVKTVASNNAEISAKTVADLKKAAWIVQLGSFKNKLNAERLTNSLRAKGYKAFTLETKSNGQTRVCVGPEFKQMAAT
ncbi:MAG: SPOR domain-containing protein, partial [Pseudomonadota bacterium]